jgi:hypothetical protein
VVERPDGKHPDVREHGNDAGKGAAEYREHYGTRFHQFVAVKKDKSCQKRQHWQEADGDFKNGIY